MARCSITSALRDPFTTRMARPNSLGALGLKPGDSPLTLRFVTKPDKAPAAGYSLTARRAPDGQPRELGTTDRSGRIVLKPRFADGLVILRLLAGNIEPMVELPMMPGESSDERVIDFNPKPHTVALETQIESLRDEVVDLVALRARLESRMKARFEGEDWAGLEEALNEFGRLTPRDEFAQRLAKLKEDAAQAQSNLKQAILTKTATRADHRPPVDDRSLPRQRALHPLPPGTRQDQKRGPGTRQEICGGRSGGACAYAQEPVTGSDCCVEDSTGIGTQCKGAGRPLQPAQAEPQPRRNPPKAKSDVPF